MDASPDAMGVRDWFLHRVASTQVKPNISGTSPQFMDSPDFIWFIAD